MRMRSTFVLVAGIAMLISCGGDDVTNDGIIIPSADGAGTQDVSYGTSEPPDDALSGQSAADGADAAEPIEASNEKGAEPDGPSDLARDDSLSTDAPRDVLTDLSLDEAEVGLDEGGADGGAATTKICAVGCATTEECRGDASSSKLLCDPDSHRCVNCIDDVPCVAGASLWTRGCAVDGDCAPNFGDYCVDVGGLGVCAFDKAKIGMQSCFGNDSTYTISKHGDAGMVDVCAKLTNTCDRKRGRCVSPCTPCDAGPCTSVCTAARGGKICSEATRRCECASDDDCAAPLGHCNVRTAQCECVSISDCAPDGGALVCR